MDDQKQPEVLGISVGDEVGAQDIFGQIKNKIFINPTNDPKIAGLTQVNSAQMLTSIAKLAEDYAKEKGKPVVIILKV
jgi:catabolite regulation protein CreA